MTKTEGKQEIEKLGGILGGRKALIGGGLGCLGVVAGLVLACALLFGWVGNTVSAAVDDNQAQVGYTIADDWGKAPGAKDTRNEAAGFCEETQEAVGTVYADGSWAGWQCVEKRR